MKRRPTRDRNDTRQYDDLVDEWWRPEGRLAALHWLADARASVIPSASPAGDILIDVGCGGGLMAPHVHGYRHVGIDVTTSALLIARRHGVDAVRASAGAIPVADEVARVVIAGEILEHVSDLETVVAELCRVTAPGGTIVIDTINATALARFALVTVAERLPGGPPPGIHDPALFVDAHGLQRLSGAHGVDLAIWGIHQRPQTTAPSTAPAPANRSSLAVLEVARNLDTVWSLGWDPQGALW